MRTDKNNAEGGFFALYTQRSRRTIVLAQEEARSMDHRYIGTAHLLLGLLRVGDGVAHNALSTLGIALEDAQRRVGEMVGRDVDNEGLEPSSTGQLPFTPRMKEVLTQAVLEARWLDHDRHIGTEHLLLGLSGQYDGVAARVLNEQGVTPGTIRKEIMKNITAGYPREGQTEPSGKTIEAWVGRQVRVAVENMGNGEPGQFACTLEGVDALREQQRRAGMPEVVEPYVGQPGQLKMSFGLLYTPHFHRHRDRYCQRSLFSFHPRHLG